MTVANYASINSQLTSGLPRHFGGKYVAAHVGHKPNNLNNVPKWGQLQRWVVSRSCSVEITILQTTVFSLVSSYDSPFARPVTSHCPLHLSQFNCHLSPVTFHLQWFCAISHRFPNCGQSLPRIQACVIELLCTNPVHILGNDCPQFKKLLQDCTKSLYKRKDLYCKPYKETWITFTNQKPSKWVLHPCLSTASRPRAFVI